MSATLPAIGNHDVKYKVTFNNFTKALLVTVTKNVLQRISSSNSLGYTGRKKVYSRKKTGSPPTYSKILIVAPVYMNCLDLQTAVITFSLYRDSTVELCMLQPKKLITNFEEFIYL